MTSGQNPTGSGKSGGRKKQATLSPQDFEVDNTGNLVVKSDRLDQLVKGAGANARAASVLRPAGGATADARAIRITIGVDF